MRVLWGAVFLLLYPSAVRTEALMGFKKHSSGILCSMYSILTPHSITLTCVVVNEKIRCVALLLSTGVQVAPTDLTYWDTL